MTVLSQLTAARKGQWSLSSLVRPMSSARDWRQLYEAATHETDRVQLPVRISAAETAINVRMAEIWLGRGGCLEEQDAMAHALQALRVLRKKAA